MIQQGITLMQCCDAQEASHAHAHDASYSVCAMFMVMLHPSEGEPTRALVCFAMVPGSLDSAYTNGIALLGGCQGIVRALIHAIMELPEEVDLLVLGTGLQEALLAACGLPAGWDHTIGIQLVTNIGAQVRCQGRQKRAAPGQPAPLWVRVSDPGPASLPSQAGGCPAG